MFAGPRTALHIAPSPRACDMQGAPHVSEWTWMQIRKLIALSCCIYSNFVQSKVSSILPRLLHAPRPHSGSKSSFRKCIPTPDNTNYPTLPQSDPREYQWPFSSKGRHFDAIVNEAWRPRDVVAWNQGIKMNQEHQAIQMKVPKCSEIFSMARPDSCSCFVLFKLQTLQTLRKYHTNTCTYMK